jgi:hypothetical protein
MISVHERPTPVPTGDDLPSGPPASGTRVSVVSSDSNI